MKLVQGWFAVMVLGLLAAEAGAADAIVWKLASGYSDSSFHTINLREFARDVDPLRESHATAPIAGERVQLAQVGRAALGEVLVRLRGDADRHGAQPHQFGVGHLLPAQHDRRQAAGGQRGYDFWVARDFSLGLLARFTYVHTWSGGNSRSPLNPDLVGDQLRFGQRNGVA